MAWLVWRLVGFTAQVIIQSTVAATRRRATCSALHGIARVWAPRPSLRVGARVAARRGGTLIAERTSNPGRCCSVLLLTSWPGGDLFPGAPMHEQKPSDWLPDYESPPGLAGPSFSFSPSIPVGTPPPLPQEMPQAPATAPAVGSAPTWDEAKRERKRERRARKKESESRNRTWAQGLRDQRRGMYAVLFLVALPQLALAMMAIGDRIEPHSGGAAHEPAPPSPRPAGPRTDQLMGVELQSYRHCGAAITAAARASYGRAGHPPVWGASLNNVSLDGVATSDRRLASRCFVAQPRPGFEDEFTVLLPELQFMRPVIFPYDGDEDLEARALSLGVAKEVILLHSRFPRSPDNPIDCRSGGLCIALSSTAGGAP